MDFLARDTPTHINSDEAPKNIETPKYWASSGRLKSNKTPVKAGPIAEPRTIAAAAAALIDPRCLVPKFSAQNAFGSVAVAPDVSPKSRNETNL